MNATKDNDSLAYIVFGAGIGVMDIVVRQGSCLYYGSDLALVDALMHGKGLFNDK